MSAGMYNSPVLLRFLRFGIIIRLLACNILRFTCQIVKHFVRQIAGYNGQAENRCRRVE